MPIFTLGGLSTGQRPWIHLVSLSDIMPVCFSFMPVCFLFHACEITGWQLD